jgi:Antibiotic biosynthesis monooxygenase
VHSWQYAAVWADQKSGGLGLMTVGFMGTAVLVFVRFFPKAGQEAGVESILRGMVHKTCQEPGCRRHDLHRSMLAPSGTRPIDVTILEPLDERVA